MGFLIEDTAQLRARIGADKSKEEIVVEAERHHSEYRKTVALFQYMIGNADWGQINSKNVKFVMRDAKILSVPYDFDFAALVDASYATYNTSYGQTSFYDRVYLGFEKDYADLEETIKHFYEKKEVLYQTIKEFKRLKSSSRNEMIDYLETFFENSEEINFLDKSPSPKATIDE